MALAVRLVAICLGVSAIWLAVWSLQWPMRVDTPILMYAAFAFDRLDLVPYRDLFEFNLPGTYLSYLMVGKLFGYDDLAVRVADLVLLSLLTYSTVVIVKDLGRVTMVVTASILWLCYLGQGAFLTLQRDFLVAILVSASLATALRVRQIKWALGLSGAFIGVAVTIKPHSVLLSPVIFAARAVAWTADTRPLARRLIEFATGLVLPVLVMFGWLIASGAWPFFHEVSTKYWPLYNDLSGSYPYRLVGDDRWTHTVQGLIFQRSSFHFLLLVAIVGCWFLWNQRSNFGRRALLIACVGGIVASHAYAAVPGKFWPPHWFLSLYFATILAGIAITSPIPKASSDTAVGLYSAMCVLLILCAKDAPAQLRFAAESPTPAMQMAESLGPHLKEGDKVQPLDWAAGGAVDALLRLRAPIATPFIYDFYFYHHVHSPFGTELRRRFLEAMEATRPRFVLRTLDRGRFTGPETTNAFPALDDLLGAKYQVLVSRPQFTIYELRGTKDK